MASKIVLQFPIIVRTMFILLNGFEISHRRLPFFSPKRMRKERYVLRSGALFRSRKTFQYDRRHHYHRSNVDTLPPMPTAPVQVSIVFANDKKLSFFAKQRSSLINEISIHFNSGPTSSQSYQQERSPSSILVRMITMKTPSSLPRW